MRLLVSKTILLITRYEGACLSVHLISFDQAYHCPITDSDADLPLRHSIWLIATESLVNMAKPWLIVAGRQEKNDNDDENCLGFRV